MFIVLLFCKKGFIILRLLVSSVVKYQRVFTCHEGSVSPNKMWQFSVQLKLWSFVQCLPSIWGKQLSINLLWTLLLVLLYWSMCTKGGCWHFLVLFHDALHSSFVQWSPFLRRRQKLIRIYGSWIRLGALTCSQRECVWWLSPLESNDFLPNYEPTQHSLVVY